MPLLHVLSLLSQHVFTLLLPLLHVLYCCHNSVHVVVAIVTCFILLS
jgi:hypothetical protein